MRVVMVSRGVVKIGPRCGGAELVAFELARHLALLDHDVTLIADIEQSVSDDALSGLTVLSLSNGRSYAQLVLLIPFTFTRWLAQHFVGNVRAARCAITALRTHGSDFQIVHAHGALATIMIGRAIRRLRLDIPLIYTEHDSTPWKCVPRGRLERLVRRGVYRAINLRACRHASLVITSYDELASELAERTGLSAEQFVVAPNGTDVKRFAPVDDSLADPAMIGPKRYCLFVGSLTERKGPDLLLRALALAKVDLCLVMVGEGPMARELRHLARRLRLADRILFTGAQPHSVVQQYYKEAAFIALPSVSETAPLVLIEALSTGKPVIATNLDGIASIVRHGENGLLVPPGDIQALSVAVRLLATDNALYARLAANASSSVRERLEWNTIAHQLNGLYSALAGSYARYTSAALDMAATHESITPVPSRAPRLAEQVNAAFLGEEDVHV